MTKTQKTFVGVAGALAVAGLALGAFWFFAEPGESQGGIVIVHDPQPDSSVASPLAVKLFYYDPNKDTDESGNIMCSEAGLVALERSISVTQTPVQDTIRLLLEGNLTEQERAEGITSEYPLPGLELEEASLSNGALTLGFNDPNGLTAGGSCRVGILWFQIRETAKQFDGVNEVRFRPEELFQP